MGVGKIGGGAPADFDPVDCSAESTKTEGPAAEAAQAVAHPIFPRSGWEDRGTLLAAQLRAKLGLDRAEGGINWRTAFRRIIDPFLQRRPPTDLPRIAPLYGMMVPGPSVGPRPGGRTDPMPRPSPIDPPSVMPLYGMPVPGPRVGPGPAPVPEPIDPPSVMPLYGMPVPGPRVGPGPTPIPEPIDPPSVMPLYGMPVPGPRVGPRPAPVPEPIDPPNVMPLYGMMMPLDR